MNSIGDLLAHTPGPSWQECVALVQQVALQLEPGQPLPAPEDLLIEPDGSITFGFAGESTRPQVADLASLLQNLLKNTDAPASLRDLANENARDEPSHSSLASFTRALAFYERPNRAADLQALGGRLAGRAQAAESERVLAEIRERVARQAEAAVAQQEQEPPKPPKPPKPPEPAKAARPSPLELLARNRALAVSAAVVLAIAAVGALAAVATPWNRAPHAGTAAAAVQPAPAATPNPGAQPSADGTAPAASATTDRGAAGDRRPVGTSASAAGHRVPDKTRSVATAHRGPSDTRDSLRPESRSVRLAANRGDETPRDNGEGTHPSISLVMGLPPANRPAISARPPAAALRAPAPATAMVPAAMTDGFSPDDAPLYSSADRDVTPPSWYRKQLPSEPSPDSKTGYFDIVVDTHGDVESVRLISPTRRYEERMLMAAAKAWKFRPAQYDGHPVKYRMRVPIVLQWTIDQ